VFTLEIGGRMLTAVLAGLFAYLVVRWWSFRARGPRV
jgi:hypothetical protein